jgi:hypothetical protein
MSLFIIILCTYFRTPDNQNVVLRKAENIQFVVCKQRIFSKKRKNEPDIDI